MNISSLNIYGFGKLIDKQIDLVSGINVIEGKNEIGKTTLMAFIRAVFFGFESRRSMHKRYEPLHGGKFGGNICLIDDKGETYLIERIYHQKMAGDAKIILPNGEIKNEEYMQNIIGRINESVFKQIFCFGISELQEVDSLKVNEINDFIYHVGTGSVNQIMKMKHDLDIKIQQLYKSGGKNPEINRLLSNLESVSLEIETISNKNIKYGEYLKKITWISGEIESLENRDKSLKKELARADLLYQMSEINEQVNKIDIMLSNFPREFKFPENGVERLDTFINNIEQLKMDHDQLLKKKQNIEVMINNKKTNTFYIENKSKIKNLDDRLSDYYKNTTTEKYLRNELINNKNEIENDLRRIDSSYSEDKIRGFECSIQDKHFIQELIENIKGLEKKLVDLEHNISGKKNTKTELEKKIVLLNVEHDKNNHSEEIINLSPLVNKYWTEIKNNEWKKQEYQNQKEEYSEQIKLNKNKKMFSLNFFSISILLIISGVVLFIIEPVYGFLFLSLSILINFIFQIYKLSVQKKLKQSIKVKITKVSLKIREIDYETNALKNKANKLIASLGFYELNELTIEKINKLRLANLQVEQVISERNKRIEEYQNDMIFCNEEIRDLINNKREKYENELKNYNNRWTGWLSKHKMETTISISIAFDLISILQKLREGYNKRDKITSELLIAKNNIKDYETTINQLLENGNINLRGSIDEQVQRLSDNLIKEEKEQLDYEHHVLAREDILNQLEKLFKRLENDENKYRELLNYAQVKDKEEFYQQEKKYKEYKELMLKREQLTNTLYNSSLKESDIEELLREMECNGKENIKMKIEKIYEQLKEHSEQIKILSEEKGKILNKVKEIEGDHTISGLNQELAGIKAELSRNVIDWTSLIFAKYILNKTMEKYEMEKQPAVILQASKYFSLMTENNYSKIISTITNNELKVISKDGTVFEPQFLSRGTVEQLFLAMRFALIDEYSNQMPLPIILDDIFVNFDIDRLNNTLNAVDDLSKKHQIIVFTCHNYLSKQFINSINRINYIELI